MVFVQRPIFILASGSCIRQPGLFCRQFHPAVGWEFDSDSAFMITKTQ